MIRKGDRAEGFKLPAAPGEEIDVGQHLGHDRVVLLFFPLAFSPVCTAEMRAMQDHWTLWSHLGAKVFGISIDSPFVTAKFRELECIPFPILSDFNRSVAGRYGVLHEDLKGLKGVAKRAAFVIGADGTVVYAWVSEDPLVEPDYEAVGAAVRAA